MAGRAFSRVRDAGDREKKYLTELIEKLNNAFGKDITNTDQVALAVHMFDKLRGDHSHGSGAEQHHGPAIASGMSGHTCMATKLA